MPSLAAQGWPADATRDRLIGDWWIYQRSGGHRNSTDDLLTAWLCCERSKAPVRNYLDLGCGTGAVLLMTANRLRPEFSLGVEAQAQSLQLAKRTIAELPSSKPHIEVLLSDFRHMQWDERRYNIVTGSPPYFPLGSGVLPADPQRAACRFEERGGIEAYCTTAAGQMLEDGRFYVVFQSIWEERVLAAATSAGLHLGSRVAVEARSGRDPFLTVYEFAKQPLQGVEKRFAVRDTQGNWTREFTELRRTMGYD